MLDADDSSTGTVCDVGYMQGFACRIRAPHSNLSRALDNFEIHPASLPRGHITLDQCAAVADFPPLGCEPYLRLAQNRECQAQGFNYYRYGVLARTIWRTTSHVFNVRSRTFRDEVSILECFRDLYLQESVSSSLALVHGSLVQVSGVGVLITGACRAGKTTLVIRLLSETRGAILIADGLCLLGRAADGVVGQYIPRRMYVRFGTVFDCEQLRHLGHHPCDCNATQVLDSSTIRRIMQNESRNVDLSLTMTRRAFVNALGSASSPSTLIGHVVVLEYCDGSNASLERLSPFATEAALRRHEFPKHPRFGRIERQPEVRPPSRSAIGCHWLRGIGGTLLRHGGWQTISRAVLEDLLSRCRHN